MYAAYPHCWGNDDTGQVTPPVITHTEYQESLKTNGNNLLLKQRTAGEELIEDEEISFSRKAKRAAGGGPAEDINADDFVEAISKMQFRQISVGDGVSCGITLIGNHLRCWGRADGRTYPRYVMGPFRQVAAGDMGLCVVAGEVEEGMEHPTVTEERLRAMEEEEWARQAVTDKKALIKRQVARRQAREINRKPDTLTCWGGIHGSIEFDPNRFEAWDTITLGSGIFCGVSMDSELHCSGIRYNSDFGEMHNHFLVA